MHGTKGLVILTVALLLASGGQSDARAWNSDSISAYGPDQPSSAEKLPHGKLRSRIEVLSPQAGARALQWLQSFSFPATDLNVIEIDDSGNVYYVDSLLPDPDLDSDLPKENHKGRAGIQSYTSSQSSNSAAQHNAFLLHSLPGAPNVIFLDFDGMIVAGTAWNESVHEYEAQAFDLDGDSEYFSTSERSRIAAIWHRVAEDFAPFNIDVTTEEPEVFNRNTGRVLVTNTVDANGIDMPNNESAGTAYINVFGYSGYHLRYSPALIYYDNLSNGNAAYTAEAISHEFGHNLGLSHDGSNNAEGIDASYYSGHGTGLVSWAPIMGNNFGKNVTQWSKGEYEGANELQDDLAIIGAKLEYRADDHGNTLATASRLKVDPDGQVVSSNPELDPHDELHENKGLIGSSDDLDIFSFVTGDGTISLNVTPAWDAFNTDNGRRGANLDVQALLVDSNGDELTLVDPLSDTQAALNATVKAGTYYLSVSGVGNDVTPYSAYNSMGQYFINGSVPPPPLLDTTAPSPNPMGWATTPAPGSDTEITMQAVTASDENGGVEYKFICISGGAGCVNSPWQSGTHYSATGLAPGTDYTFRVKARDKSKNQTRFSVRAKATTQASPQPDYNDYVASSEQAVIGLVDGTFSDTSSDNAIYQRIKESVSAGIPETRYSHLEHHWVFDISAGSKTTLLANVKSGNSTEGDSFDFEYSLDEGNSFSHLFNVTSTKVRNIQSALIPASFGGSVIIRVIDTDRTPGKRKKNSVVVDHLFIRVSNP